MPVRGLKPLQPQVHGCLDRGGVTDLLLQGVNLLRGQLAMHNTGLSSKLTAQSLGLDE